MNNLQRRPIFGRVVVVVVSLKAVTKRLRLKKRVVLLERSPLLKRLRCVIMPMLATTRCNVAGAFSASLLALAPNGRPSRAATSGATSGDWHTSGSFLLAGRSSYHPQARDKDAEELAQFFHYSRSRQIWAHDLPLGTYGVDGEWVIIEKI